MKNTLRKMLALFLCLSLSLSLAPGAWAEESLMTANEFIGYLQYVLDREDSVYRSGGQWSSGKFDGSNIYFDCWGLGESIIATHGEIVYNRNSSLDPYSLYDTSLIPKGNISGATVINMCPNKSDDFSSLVPGEWLYLRGADFGLDSDHMGYYIGNGQVIECTPAWRANGVTQSQIGSDGTRSRNGVTSLKWTYHGKVPWIKYNTVPTYLDKCTWTPCSDTIKITSSTYLKSLPCSNDTAKKYGYKSENVITSALPLGTTLRTSGLYKNTEGNYWYAATIISEPNAGKSGYIYQGDSTVLHTPQSTLDEATGGAGTIHVRGWSFDRDALNSSVPIHVYVGGPAGSGAPGYAINANSYRPDVNNAYPGVGDYHGFDATISVSPRGNQTLYFYALDIGSELTNPQFATANVTIPDPTPTGSLMTVGAGRTIPDGDYIIATAADSNYFLDIVGEDLPAANSANVSLYGPRNGEVPAYDVWTVKYIDEGGFYSICQKGTNMSLDVDGASITAGGNIQVYTHHGDSCQQWSIFKNEDGSYRIRAKCSGFSLDYYDGVLAAGTNVVQWFDTDYGNQKWTFILCACTVTYDANGGTNAPDSQTAEIGSSITLSNDIPSRASTTESYTVTLNANGGSVSQSSLSATHTTSYSFKNWNTKASGIGTSYNPGASYPANTSATLYAQWNYTIKYNSIILPVPTRTGYVFKGWGTSSDATSGVTGDYTPNGNVTLYAIWEEVKYTVSYDANGGIGAPEAQTVRAGTVALLSTVEPTREGYVFLGWASSSTATAPQYLAGSSFTPEKDTTLFAVWEKGTLSEWSEIKPTGADESLIETKIQYRYRDKETTTSTESSMDGWTPDGSEQSWGDYGPWSEWQDSAISASDSTRVETRTAYPYYYFYCTYCGTGARYPYWGGSLRCEICGNTGTRPVGASAVEWFPNPWSDSVRWGNDSEKYYQYINGEIWWNWTDGSPKTQYKASTRGTETIYHFYRWTGWSAWGDSEITENDTREVDTRTLYRYVVTPYTITYDANGGTGCPAAQTKTQGTNLTLTTATPTRADTSTGNYTVTLNANGGSVSPATLSAARTTSYTFKNWDTAADGSGTSYSAGATYSTDADVTLYAQWNSSTSTAAVTLPTPTRNGYNFLGWGTSSSAIVGVTGSYTPTGNVTLYAIWDANAYPVSYDANGGTNAPNSQAKIHDTALTLTSSKPSRANASAGSYTVTLNANGGSVSTNSLTAVRTTSYTFKNWNTVTNGSGTSYAPGASYTANAALTLYAQWNSNTSTAAVTLPTPTREGYSFKGWGTSNSATSGVIGSYTPDGNVTLYAVWDANSYPVSYDANGGTNAPNSQAKIHDTALTLTTFTPTRADASAGSYTVTLNANGGNVSTAFLSAARTTSYSFKNWNTAANGSGTSYAPSSSYTANAALTLYAQWNSSTSTAAVTLPTPTRNGYSFLGWGTNSSAASGVTGSYTPTGNVTLYAIWDANSYPVSYDANGGTDAPNSQAKIHDSALTLTTSTPNRANASAGSYTVALNANGGSVSTSSLTAVRTTSYSFKNWNTAANGSGTSYAPGASYTANAALTLYAQWNSSTSTDAVTLPTPTRQGYSFKGWGTSNSATSGVTGSYTPDGNVTLYAVWDANFYPVSYDANGGTNAPNSQTKIHDTALLLATTTPTRANVSAGNYTVTLNANGGNVSTSNLSAARTTSYSFKDWNTAANGSGTSYAPGVSYTANAALTLYAQWNSSTSTAVVTLPTPTRNGYSFKGWGTGENATEVVTGNYTPSEDINLFAIWEANKYTIKFVNDDGTVLQTGDIAYGVTPAYTGQTPTKAATAQYTYTFKGWDKNIVTVTGAATYTATYNSTVNKYTVKFVNEDGTVLQSSELAYSETPSYSGQTPTKAATAQYTYTFKGWDNTPVAVTGLAIYVATYTETPNRYTITFNTDGGSAIQPITLAYGAAVTAPTNPTRADFIFLRWNPALPSTMPANDLTVKAIWAPIFGTPNFKLPVAIKQIEDEAFEGVSFMTVVDIPYGCESIGKWAFKNCIGLTQIRIPASVTYIDDLAFVGCTNVFIYGTYPSAASSFCDSHTNCTFVVEDTSE